MAEGGGMRDFFFFIALFAAEEANIHFRQFQLIPVVHQKQFMYSHGHCWLLEICIMFFNNIKSKVPNVPESLYNN